MTLIEMMIALVIFSFVMAGALAVLRAESRSFALGSERVAMYQNGRFAMNEMEKDLRTSGAGSPDIQPQMIYVSDSVIVFNANYWTNTSGDVEAVYYNPDAPDSAVKALRASTKITIPYTAIQYPDTNYLTGGVNSAAETISFHFKLDSSTTRADDYVLYRRVNTLNPEIVATNILKTSGTPFFQYFRRNTPAGGGTSTLTQVTSGLPWRHTAPIHLAINDTGVLARIDSIRAVRVSFTVTNGQTGTKERLRSLTRLIVLPNAGLANTKSCGDQPFSVPTSPTILGLTPPSAVAAIGGGGLPTVNVRWRRSIDEAAGEKDVERYVVWRRRSSTTDWGDPYVTVPAGDSVYLFTDVGVVSLDSLYYAISAQDCTPTMSDQRVTNLVIVP
jgi:prepilin-type N-terminal cleavage/methylation domain-containing protein